MAAQDYKPMEALSTLGGLYGLFFIIQTFGYASGARLKRGDEPKAITSAISGIQHLSNILLPMKLQAWPLGPVLCGLLLLYAVYLPSETKSAGGLTNTLVNRLFFALFLAVSLTTTAAYVAQDRVLRFMTNRRDTAQWIVSTLYFCLMAFWTFIAYWALGFLNGLQNSVWTTGPWADIVSASAIAWLLLMTFIGSAFDGALDRRLGLFD